MGKRNCLHVESTWNTSTMNKIVVDICQSGAASPHCQFFSPFPGTQGWPFGELYFPVPLGWTVQSTSLYENCGVKTGGPMQGSHDSPLDIGILWGMLMFRRTTQEGGRWLKLQPLWWELLCECSVPALWLWPWFSPHSTPELCGHGLVRNISFYCPEPQLSLQCIHFLFKKINVFLLLEIRDAGTII